MSSAIAPAGDAPGGGRRTKSSISRRVSDGASRASPAATTLIGMLRAGGVTRRQARRMVRGESVITALIGAALGMPVGIAVAALVTGSLSEYGVELALPAGTLVAFAIVAAAVGVLAAIAPARRASRLDVLRALQYE